MPLRIAVVHVLFQEHAGWEVSTVTGHVGVQGLGFGVRFGAKFAVVPARTGKP